MNLTPRIHARYRNDATGEAWDTRHYEDDAPAFPAFDGGTWRRVALTTREYTTAEAAQAELDAIEAPRFPLAERVSQPGVVVLPEPTRLLCAPEMNTGHILAYLLDGSVWRVSKSDGKPFLVRFPDAYDTPELRAVLAKRDNAAAAVWAELPHAA